MKLSDFDFDLPDDRIALRPAEPRDGARLLVLPPEGGTLDRTVRDLPSFLRPGDILVFNDTKVIPARLNGVRTREESIVAVEATLHRRLSPSRWTAFMKPGKRLKPGDRVRFGETQDRACLLGALDATVEAKGEGGEVTLSFDLMGPDLDAAIAERGMMPLPPYIAAKRPEDERDRADYQTVYAREDGSVAAPTAGLHFTPELMKKLEDKGVQFVEVTLHVGLDTFAPVTEDDPQQHKIHTEWCEVTTSAAEKINLAHNRAGAKIIAVGTTSVRTLESAARFARPGQLVGEFSGATELFILPGYHFQVVDAMITNFHLPRSTLLMLVSAFAGRDRILEVYQAAIQAGYRFYSFGDAMLIR